MRKTTKTNPEDTKIAKFAFINNNRYNLHQSSEHISRSNINVTDINASQGTGDKRSSPILSKVQSAWRETTAAALVTGIAAFAPMTAHANDSETKPQTVAATTIGFNVPEVKPRVALPAVNNGNPITSDQALELSKTAGIVFLCKDDGRRNAQCADTVFSINYEGDISSQWALGYEGYGDAKLFVSGKEAKKPFWLPDTEATNRMEAYTLNAYDHFDKQGICPPQTVEFAMNK